MTDLRRAQPSAKERAMGGVLVALFALCWMIPSFYSLILSLKSYSPLHGLAGSPWVGFANYAAIFGHAQSGQLWINSVRLRMVELASALAAGIPLALAICALRGKRSLLWASALCLLPALIPETNWFYLLRWALPAGAFAQPERFLGTYALLSALKGGGVVAFAGGLFAAHKRRGAGGLWAGVAAFVCLSLCAVFSPAASTVQLLQTPLNYAVSDTLSTNMHRMGLMSNMYGRAAALSCLRTLAQLPLAALGAFALARLIQGAPEDLPADAREAESRGLLRLPSGLLIALALVLWLGVLAAPLWGLSDWSALREPSAAETLARSAANSALGALLAFALALVLWALLLWALSKVYARGFAAFAAIALAFSGATIAQYLLARTAGLINTRHAVALEAVFAPPVVLSALLLAAAGQRAGGLRVIWAALFAACVAAAFSWGSHYAPMLYLIDRSLFPLGLLLREGSQGSGQAEALAAAASALCGAPCLILGVLAALCCRQALGARGSDLPAGSDD